MALSIEKRFSVDLDKPLNVQYGGGLMFTGDAGADTFEVTLYKSGEAYAPGGSVALNCIRADGDTVTVAGSISGNVASATLTQACCAIPGPLSVVMQIISGGNTGAVFAAAYTVMPAQTGDPIDPGTTITDIAALIAQIDAAVDSIPADYSDLLAAIAPTFSTSTAYAAGDYVWYDGDLYKFTIAHSAGAWTGSDAAAAVFATDIADLKSEVDQLSNVPTEVRQALYTLLSKAVYTETGLADDIATLSIWASDTISIAINQSSASISGTGTVQLSATTTPAGGGIIWSSSNSNVATVSANGLVTGAGNGSCVIRAMSGNAFAQCEITVSGFTMYTVTNNLTYAQSDNTVSQVAAGVAYNATITALDGYELDTVTCTMGGIAQTVVDGVIDIDSVSGDIVIVAIATKETTVVIARENKVLTHAGTTYSETTRTNGGITIMYDMDEPTTSLYPAGIIPTTGDVIKPKEASLVVYDENGTPVNYVNENTANAGSYNRWAQDAEDTMTEYSQQWTVGQYSKIAFSVDMRYVDDAYMYDKTTGQVWFAGVNTPYYGMSNISEANP